MRLLALVLFVFLLAALETNAQALSNEIGYNLEHYQHQTALTVDEGNSYYAISYTSSGFNTYSILYKADENGAVIWSQPFNAFFAEVVEIQEIIVHGGEILLAGTATECCDCSSPYAFLAKYDLDGQLIWVHSHEVESFDWFNGFSPRNLHRDANDNWVYELLGWDDFSVLIRTDNEGMLVDSIPLTSVQGGTDMLSLVDGSIAFLQESTLYQLDAEGVLMGITALMDDGIGLLQFGDSLLVLHSEGIEALNSSLEPVGTISPWTDLSAHSFESSPTGVRFQLFSENGVSVIELDNNLALISQQNIALESIGDFLLDSDENSLVYLERFPLSEQSAVRYRSFNLNAEEDVSTLRTEVEPTALEVNDSEITSYVSGDYNIVTLSFDHSILVKNNGPAVLTECRINRFVNFGICAYGYYSMEFEDLSITPGDSAWIDVGYTGFYQNAYALGDTITYSTCFFTSNPNGLVDLVVENDAICDTYQFIVTDVPEETKPEFSIYPNPASDVLHLEQSIFGQQYTVHDLEGRTILTGSIPKGTIDISSLTDGNYMLRLTGNNEASSIQRFSVVR